jgi:hypothetical protein
MPTSFQSFADQLARCAQSEDEILSFVEAFAKVRLKEIIGKLIEPPPTAVIEADDRTTAPDWTRASGKCRDPHFVQPPYEMVIGPPSWLQFRPNRRGCCNHY